jgi:enoyl-CoA hydratase/carnithine racemase
MPNAINAAVHGYTPGAGAGVAFGCHLVVAAENAASGIQS